MELKIDNGVEIVDDAFASLKTTGLFGNRYVSTDARGGGETLQPGDSILLTEPPIEIGDSIGKYVFRSDEKQ